VAEGKAANAKMSQKEKTKTCFVICPIGADGSEERKRSDTALKYVFAKAVEPLGYKVIRADKISEPGMITQQILKHLMTADLVIADMTGHNANVFYELAVRHAVEKPVVHVIEANQKIPFDVSDLRAIPMKLDLDGAEEAISKIREQVEAIEAGNVGDTPVKLAAAIQKLGQDPGAEVLEQILNALSTMARRFDRLVESLPPGIRPAVLPSGEIVNVWSSGFYGDQTLDRFGGARTQSFKSLADILGGPGAAASNELTPEEKALMKVPAKAKESGLPDV